MSSISSLIGHLPGMGTLVDSFEQAVAWGIYPRYFTGAYISANAIDSGNTPSSTLRMGLVMGKITASGQWTNYSATATDGSQVAQGVLFMNLRLQDVLTETNQPRFFPLMVSGGVQGSKLYGLDNLARSQMANRFIFDDNLPGNADFPWLSEQAKTANYQLLSTDNLGLFTNAGALGSVTFTLPAIANGYCFRFRAVAAQTLKVASFEGANLVGLNSAASSSVAFQTGAGIIGGGFRVESNAAGTLWYVTNESAGSNTITLA